MNKYMLIATMLKEMVLSHVSPRIVHLILHVILECNMRCKHCFVDFKQPTETWTSKEIRDVAEKLPHLVWLDIGGGEPLMRQDLEEIVSLFRFQELSIPTNGWDTEGIVKRLTGINKISEGKLLVTLSLEGMQKTHDSIRRKGSYERTVNTYRALKESGVKVKFNTVLSEKNADEVIPLMNFVRSLEPDFHSILLLRGTPSDSDMRLPPPVRIAELENEIYAIQQTYDYGRKGILQKIHKRYQHYKRKVEKKTIAEKRQVVPCLAGKSHAVIWADGSVSPCEMLPPRGNIRQQAFDDILKSDEFRKAVEDIQKGKCYCTHDCNMVENILFHPKSYLDLLF